MSFLDSLVFNDQGLIPAVIQDDSTGQVLTLCYMNQEALDKTLETGFVHVFRRSAGRLMMKGETSGHTQAVKSIFLDCEGKSLLVRVDQKVAACHKNYFTCYFREYSPEEPGQLKVHGEPVK
ncbi:MAG TPA: phosphoribosyl-AMP cyclohydrolase [Armatimonadota bacterium]|nr:phosphoribosyl-AMP cyclohydrolase [Armatimonadota bacterium]HPP74167.1 phosphoribosyl-AMP cyclohydrolase [Armatimonadota bacterium]